MSERTGVLDIAGPGAPPRRNGELVFDAPWQSRLFGVTMALYESGRFDWEEFRRRLIAAVARRERSDEPWSYYACWLEAFEELLRAKQVCAPEEMNAVLDRLAARPAGHDHRHGGGAHGDHEHGEHAHGDHRHEDHEDHEDGGH